LYIGNREFKLGLSFLAPDGIFQSIFNYRSAETSELNFINGQWMISDSKTGLQINLRYPRDAMRYYHGVESKINRVRARYTLTDFVQISPGDIVVDVGGYVGEFALSVSQDAKLVHVFEPDKSSYDALQNNVRLNNLDSIYCWNKLIWNKHTDVEFNAADDGSESSVLNPDAGGVIQTLVMSAIPLHEAVDFDVDFLKIDAEGSELKVIEGLGDLRPRKIAIDCTEVDANGDLPDTEVEEAIRSLGYVTKSVESEYGPMVFGKLRN